MKRSIFISAIGTMLILVTGQCKKENLPENISITEQFASRIFPNEGDCIPEGIRPEVPDICLFNGDDSINYVEAASLLQERLNQGCPYRFELCGYTGGVENADSLAIIKTFDYLDDNTDQLYPGTFYKSNNPFINGNDLNCYMVKMGTYLHSAPAEPDGYELYRIEITPSVSVGIPFSAYYHRVVAYYGKGNGTVFCL